jgi:GH15 family glucan-1,4-alpha-glucosidase
MSNLSLWPIGNCQVSALIDNEANFVWGCIPRVDGDPIFCSLLNGDEREKGIWSIRLANQTHAIPRYSRNSAILITRLIDADGSAVDVIDFCPRYETAGRMYRPVAYARIIRPVSGRPRVTISLCPMRDYGTEPAPHMWGSNHIRYDTGAQQLRLTTNAPIGYILERTEFRVEQDHYFFLGPDEPFIGDIGERLRQMEQATDQYWKQWVRGLATPIEWQEAVIRAAITLKLCQHEETGAIVAALTTSIPEAPHSARNWDYRYCWIRDAYYTVQVLNRLGALDVLENYLRYLRNIVDGAAGGQIQPLYTVMGGTKIDEREDTKLAGYRGMGPVRVGNAAYHQVQHDAYGQIVMPTAQAFFDHRLFRMGDEQDFASLEEVGEVAWRMHDQPDAGLWEFRTRQLVHTYSAVMCWAACDRLAKVADHMGYTEKLEHWQQRADHIRAVIEDQAWVKEAGHFGAAFGETHLDASLLQMVELRFLEADDPRFLATFEAVEKALRRGEHMLRYDKEDDFGAPETAFNICTFWLIEALHMCGRHEEARDLFIKMLGHRTPSGLLSEDLDFTTGELWGNFPQTYSLVGIIHCATLLSRSWGTVR